MKTLIDWYYRTFGCPIWTEDFEGKVFKSRLIRGPHGEIVIRKIYGWVTAYEDGTVHEKSYLRKWWPR